MVKSVVIPLLPVWKQEWWFEPSFKNHSHTETYVIVVEKHIYLYLYSYNKQVEKYVKSEVHSRYHNC